MHEAVPTPEKPYLYVIRNISEFMRNSGGSEYRGVNREQISKFISTLGELCRDTSIEEDDRGKMSDLAIKLAGLLSSIETHYPNNRSFLSRMFSSLPPEGALESHEKLVREAIAEILGE